MVWDRGRRLTRQSADDGSIRTEFKFPESTEKLATVLRVCNLCARGGIPGLIGQSA